ncbi:hypothetical protein ACTG0T_01685 [Halococcus morrhuae DSM 1307]|nr:hypothetical protein [Halococcus morrhuae]
MSDIDKWVPQVGRIYVETKEALERADDPQNRVPGAFQYASQFNEILEKIRDTESSDAVIESIGLIKEEINNPVHKFDKDFVDQNEGDMANEVVLKSGRLIDYLGYTIPDNHRIRANTDSTIIRMEQTNQQEQRQSTEITIKSTIRQIRKSRNTPSDKDELEELVREFEDEISKEDADQSRIQEIIQKADKKSTDVAANLLMLALQYGIIQAAELL